MVDTWRRMSCFVSPAGRNKIKDWRDDLSPGEKADADEFIKNMRRIKDWAFPDWKPLFDGIGELRWKSEKKQHRLIGYFNEEIFIALIGCTHKQKQYSPTDALDTCKKRRDQIKSGEGSICNYDL